MTSHKQLVPYIRSRGAPQRGAGGFLVNNVKEAHVASNAATECRWQLVYDEQDMRLVCIAQLRGAHPRCARAMQRPVHCTLIAECRLRAIE